MSELERTLCEAVAARFAARAAALRANARPHEVMEGSGIYALSPENVLRLRTAADLEAIAADVRAIAEEAQEAAV